MRIYFNSIFQRRWLRRSLLLLAALGFSLILPVVGQMPSKASHPVEAAQVPQTSTVSTAIPAQTIIGQISSPVSQAQSQQGDPEAPKRPKRIRRSDIWKEVYRQLPDLPREDQYRDRDKGSASASTLVHRLILYHGNRGRSVFHRLDWKLTLADYLGINDLLDSGIYPSSERLKPDPLQGDRAAIATLNRAQRDELVNLLVSLYNPRLPAPAAVTDENLGEVVNQPGLLQEEPAPEVPTQPVVPPASQPGDAQLLLQ